ELVRRDGGAEYTHGNQRPHLAILEQRQTDRGGPEGWCPRVANRETVHAGAVQYGAEARLLLLRERLAYLVDHRIDPSFPLFLAAEGEIGTAHRGVVVVGAEAQHGIRMRPGADRAGPELDRNRVAVGNAEADRPVDTARQVDGERPRRLDDPADPIISGRQIL